MITIKAIPLPSSLSDLTYLTYLAYLICLAYLKTLSFLVPIFLAIWNESAPKKFIVHFEKVRVAFSLFLLFITISFLYFQ